MLGSSFVLVVRLAVVELSTIPSKTTSLMEHVELRQAMPLSASLQLLLFPIIGCVVIFRSCLHRPHFCQKLDGTEGDVLSHISSDAVSTHEGSEGSGSLQAALNLPFYMVVSSSWLEPSQGCFQCA